MTKKHFIALADWMKNHAGENYRGGFTSAHIESLANFCASQNPRFNRERWIGYINGECGKNGGKVKSTYCFTCDKPLTKVVKGSIDEGAFCSEKCYDNSPSMLHK